MTLVEIAKINSDGNLMRRESWDIGIRVIGWPLAYFEDYAVPGASLDYYTLTYDDIIADDWGLVWF